MSLPIISADARLAEPRGIKGCIFGKSGIGKTTLLWTLDAQSTLFMDLEAGDLAIEGWQGDTIRPRTWTECRGSYARFWVTRHDQAARFLGRLRRHRR